MSWGTIRKVKLHQFAGYSKLHNLGLNCHTFLFVFSLLFFCLFPSCLKVTCVHNKAIITKQLAYSPNPLRVLSIAVVHMSVVFCLKMAYQRFLAAFYNLLRGHFHLVIFLIKKTTVFFKKKTVGDLALLRNTLEI